MSVKDWVQHNTPIETISGATWDDVMMVLLLKGSVNISNVDNPTNDVEYALAIALGIRVDSEQVGNFWEMYDYAVKYGLFNHPKIGTIYYNINYNNTDYFKGVDIPESIDITNHILDRLTYVDCVYYSHLMCHGTKLLRPEKYKIPDCYNNVFNYDEIVFLFRMINQQNGSSWEMYICTTMRTYKHDPKVMETCRELNYMNQIIFKANHYKQKIAMSHNRIEKFKRNYLKDTKSAMKQ